MKNQILIIIALFLPFAANTQVTFEKIITKGSKEHTYSVIRTFDGGYAILGGLEVAPGPNRWLVKTDQLGDTLWTRTFHGAGNFYPSDRSLVQTADGGFTFIAYRNGKSGLLHASSSGDSLWEKELTSCIGYSLALTSGQGYVVTGRDASGTGIKVALAGPGGDLIWSRAFNFIPPAIMGLAESNAIRELPGGGFIVAGYITTGYFTHYPFLLRIGPAGDSLWYKEYKWYMDAGFYSVDSAGNDGFFAGGFEINQHYSAMIMKLDASGDTVWTHLLPSVVGQFFNSIRATGDGGAVACGSHGTNYFPDSSRVYLAKYTSAGNLSWKKKVGNFQNTYGSSVELTYDNGYIICGDVIQTALSDGRGLLVKTDGSGNISGVGDHDLQPVIRVYPNPATGSIFIENKEQDCTLTLFDSSDRPVLDQTIPGPVASVDVSALSPGLYFYRASKNGIVLDSGKIIMAKE